MIEDPPEKYVRQWAIDSSVLKNKKGTSINSIIKDAYKIYEFVNPSKCEVVILKNKDRKK